MRRRFRGTVEVLIKVGVDGEALEVSFERGTGDANWDRLLKDALLEGEYAPARCGGEPRAAELRQRIHFR